VAVVSGHHDRGRHVGVRHQHLLNLARFTRKPRIFT
jgi:hypothetical protein